jgi:hypothetical protein
MKHTRTNYKYQYEQESAWRIQTETESKGLRAKLDIAELNIKNLQTDNRLWMAHVIVLGRAIDKLIKE